MKKEKIAVPFMLFLAGLIVLVVLIMQPVSIHIFRDKIAVLFPKGIIALEERNLLFTIQAIMLLVIIPVYILTFVFSWKYRAQNNPHAKYDPHLVDSTVAEYFWWAFHLS